MKDSYIFYKDNLCGEYKSVFEQVEMFVLTQSIDESTREERLGDLLDVFLTAQDAGRPVQKIVGNNLEQFCRTFCSDLGIRNRIYNLLDGFKSLAWVMTVISVIDILWFVLDMEDVGRTDFWHSVSSLNIPTYFAAIFICSVICLLTNMIFHHIMFRTKRISMKMLNIVSCVEAVACFCFIFWSFSLEDILLFAIPAWVVGVFSCAYLAVYYLVFGKRNRRQKVTFTQLVREEARKEFPKTMEKKFEKERRKSLKKGRGELTIEEFLEREEKSCDRTEKVRFLYMVLPFAATAIAYAIIYLSVGFESALDSWIFIAIMMIVESSVLLGLWKVVKCGIEERREWIQIKRNELEESRMCGCVLSKDGVAD